MAMLYPWLSRSLPMEAAAIPLPNAERTPLVIKINLLIVFYFIEQ